MTGRPRWAVMRTTVLILMNGFWYGVERMVYSLNCVGPELGSSTLFQTRHSLSYPEVQQRWIKSLKTVWRFLHSHWTPCLQWVLLIKLISLEPWRLVENVGKGMPIQVTPARFHADKSNITDNRQPGNCRAGFFLKQRGGIHFSHSCIRTNMMICPSYGLYGVPGTSLGPALSLIV